MIERLRSMVEEKITEKIKSTSYFSIMTDTTTDTTKKDMLSEVDRYVDIEYDDNRIPSKVNV